MRTSTVHQMYALGWPWPFEDHPHRRAPTMGVWSYQGQAVRFVYDLALAPKKRQRRPGYFALDFGQMEKHPAGHWHSAAPIPVPGDTLVEWDYVVPELIPIYGRFPPDLALQVERFLELAERKTQAQWQAWHAAVGMDYPDDRDQYQTWPWTMADLCGSTWRNVHTGHTRPAMLRVDRFGCYVLSDAPSPDACLGIGIWVNGRYYIDHDVRSDHLPPDVQLRWFRVEYTHLHVKLRGAQRGLQDSDSSRRYLQSVIAGTQQELAEIEARATVWAREHGLFGGSAWRFFAAGLPTRQLALF
ncbi:MAG: hypothetical protein KKA73_18325 [Chloroflexi bacterium]|nr:hypothetical protein [Chloroflexota bacterium]MBU1749644.1 hypothetical protein [Chloroflexota bacterium]